SVEETTVEFAFAPATDGRTKVTVAHSRLASSEEVQIWKQFWTEWIDALDEGS
ncbi:MAG TPA: hypothetical protein DEG43_04250, partial [Acidimicrobiaceae bacterium]|nr:hypothetical protein [Acidimicrobiaceae bacterium]